MINEKSVSLCMVVYNPYLLLINAIDSVDSIIDEIVIVDQGSSEEESERIKTFLEGKRIGGKNIIYHKTTNKGNADFDRMFCYSLATKDYILHLDADETIPQSTIERIGYLLKEYEPDVMWFLFHNLIIYKGKEINLQKFLGDDPHPRFWKREIEYQGRKVPPLQWGQEAHKFPNILSQKQVFCKNEFNHIRELPDVIQTHLRRSKNIEPQAIEIERNFIRNILNEFDRDIKKEMSEQFTELNDYLK